MSLRAARNCPRLSLVPNALFNPCLATFQGDFSTHSLMWWYRPNTTPVRCRSCIFSQTLSQVDVEWRRAALHISQSTRKSLGGTCTSTFPFFYTPYTSTENLSILMLSCSINDLCALLMRFSRSTDISTTCLATHTYHHQPCHRNNLDKLRTTQSTITLSTATLSEGWIIPCTRWGLPRPGWICQWQYIPERVGPCSNLQTLGSNSSHGAIPRGIVCTSRLPAPSPTWPYGSSFDPPM